MFNDELFAGNIFASNEKTNNCVSQVFDEYKYSIVNDNIIKTVNDIIKIIEFEEILYRINEKVKFVNIL